MTCLEDATIARLMDLIGQFARCETDWMEKGIRAEIRMDWLTQARELKEEIEKQL